MSTDAEKAKNLYNRAQIAFASFQFAEKNAKNTDSPEEKAAFWNQALNEYTKAHKFICVSARAVNKGRMAKKLEDEQKNDEILGSRPIN